MNSSVPGDPTAHGWVVWRVQMPETRQHLTERRMYRYLQYLQGTCHGRELCPCFFRQHFSLGCCWHCALAVKSWRWQKQTSSCWQASTVTGSWWCVSGEW